MKTAITEINRVERINNRLADAEDQNKQYRI